MGKTYHDSVILTQAVDNSVLSKQLPQGKFEDEFFF